MSKLPAKYYMIVFIFLMTLFIGLILSFILTWVSMGFVEDFPSIWLNRFLSTWIIVIPTVAIVLPCVRAITNLIVEQNSNS
ncbi:DUF2798 domain-containing protein [Phaeodactylibacter sp.]|uniref:DUF2798 domain-containing protein n=2 Tax=Phaeodactylibacter sp. TaxID=1940289 RepID=UPI003416E8D0